MTDAGPQDRPGRALDLAFRHLSRRQRTVAEVRGHLEAKEVEPAAIDEAIAELVEQRYLDDAQYAAVFAEDRRNLDAWGNDRIARRLAQLGVGREDIDAALAAQDPGSELDAAVELLRRRFRVPPETDRERERALGMLVRKGYELELAYDAVRALDAPPDTGVVARRSAAH